MLHLYSSMLSVVPTKIPALLYLLFWAFVSVFALVPVRVFLYKLDTFRDHSFIVQQILNSFLCFSLSNAFLFNSPLTQHARNFGRFPPVWCCLYLNQVLSTTYIYTVHHGSPNLLTTIGPSLLMLSIFLLNLDAITFHSGSKKLVMSFFHMYSWVIFTAFTFIIYKDEYLYTFTIYHPMLPYLVGFSISYLLFLYQEISQSFVIMEIPLNLKIVVGVIGNILSNHYLKDKSLGLLWLVISLSIFWLGNIAMTQSTWQAGIFGFLVGAILDIAGELFGLKLYMWIVGGGCAVLYILFNQLDNLKLRYPRSEGVRLPTLRWIHHDTTCYRCHGKQEGCLDVAL